MTDYKNELETLLQQYDNAWNTAFNEVDPHNHDKWSGTYESMKLVAKRSQEIKKETQAAIEALLSQHSKKRELEAERRIWQYLELDGDCTIYLKEKDEWVEPGEFINFKIDQATDRINKLTNGEGDKNE